MKAKGILSILTILLGYGLIIGGFTILGEDLEQDIRVLDTVVSCFLFSLLIQVAFYPLVNLNRVVHREVASMGVRWSTLILYFTLAVGLMILGVIENISFKYQLMGHILLFFLFLLGCIAYLHIEDKVYSIHHKEQELLERKELLHRQMSDFIANPMYLDALSLEMKQRLCNLHEALRFLAPTLNVESTHLEKQFSQLLLDLKVLLREPVANQAQINEKINLMESILIRRKSIK